MSVKINRGSATASLNITPLIDIVFLLLIFFLVATKFAEEDRQLDVQLPSASEARPLTQEPLQMFIGVNQDGEFFVDGQKLSLLEVDEAMRRAVANNPVNQAVVIRADKRVPFDFVVQVMDLCNRHAISDYTVTVQE